MVLVIDALEHDRESEACNRINWLNPRGLRKQQHELTAQIPCTLLYSFDQYMQSIKTSAQALGSLMQHSELDSEAKEIIQAMMRLRGEYVDAQNAKRGSKKK